MESQSLLIDREVMKHLSEQTKEKVRQTMLSHEQTFRNQVQELHKLYKVQRMLMQNADNNPPQATESFALSAQTVVNPHQHRHQIAFNSNEDLWNQRYSSGESSLQYNFEWGNQILQQSRTQETIEQAALLSSPTKTKSIAPLEEESWRPSLKSISKRKKPIDLEQLPCDDDETDDDQEDSPNQQMAANDTNSLNNASSHEYSTASNFSKHKDINYPLSQTIGKIGLFYGQMKDDISDSGKLSSESCSQEKQVQKGPRVNFLTTGINPPQEKSSERVSAFPKWMKTAEKPRDDEPLKQAQQSQGSIALTRENSTQTNFLQVIDIHPKTIGNDVGNSHSVVTYSQKVQRRTEWFPSETEHRRERQLFYDSSNVYIPTYHIPPVTESSSTHSSEGSYLQFLQQQQQTILQSQQTSSTMQVAWLPPGHDNQGCLAIYEQPPPPLGLLGGFNLDASQTGRNLGFRAPESPHSPNPATFPTNITEWKNPSKLVPDGVDVEFKLGVVDNTTKGKELPAQSLSPESKIHKNRMGEALNGKHKNNERFRISGGIEPNEDHSTSTTFQNSSNGLSAQRFDDDDIILPDFRHYCMSTSSAFSSIDKKEHLKDADCSKNTVSQLKLHQENQERLGNNNTSRRLFDKDNEQESEKQKSDKASNRLILHGKQNCEVSGFEHNAAAKENGEIDLLNRNMDKFKLQNLIPSNEESRQLLFYYSPKPSLEDNKPGVSLTESQPKEDNTDHSRSNLKCNNSVITFCTDKASDEFGSSLPDFVEKSNAKVVEVMETSQQLFKGSSENPEKGVIDDDTVSLAAAARILMSFAPENTTSSSKKAAVANIVAVECHNDSLGHTAKVKETHETTQKSPLDDFSVSSAKQDANTMNTKLWAQLSSS